MDWPFVFLTKEPPIYLVDTRNKISTAKDRWKKLNHNCGLPEKETV